MDMCIYLTWVYSVYVSLYSKGCPLHSLRDGLAFVAVWKGHEILTINFKNELPLSLNYFLQTREILQTWAPNFNLPQILSPMDTVIEVSTYCWDICHHVTLMRCNSLEPFILIAMRQLKLHSTCTLWMERDRMTYRVGFAVISEALINSSIHETIANTVGKYFS